MKMHSHKIIRVNGNFILTRDFCVFFYFIIFFFNKSRLLKHLIYQIDFMLQFLFFHFHHSQLIHSFTADKHTHFSHSRLLSSSYAFLFGCIRSLNAGKIHANSVISPINFLFLLFANIFSTLAFNTNH